MHTTIDLPIDLHAAHCDALDPCPACRTERARAEVARMRRLREQLLTPAQR